MKKIKSFGMDLLGAVGETGDWFSLAVTAGLVAVLVLLGIATHHIGMLDGLHNYAVAMLISAAFVSVSVGAAKSARGSSSRRKIPGRKINMYNEQTFESGVQARTVAGGIVQHPVVITLDGVATELTLADAVKLRDGLATSIAATEAAESAGVARNGHHFTMGKTMHGMSAVPSKLPA